LACVPVALLQCSVGWDMALPASNAVHQASIFRRRSMETGSSWSRSWMGPVHPGC